VSSSAKNALPCERAHHGAVDDREEAGVRELLVGQQRRWFHRRRRRHAHGLELRGDVSAVARRRPCGDGLVHAAPVGETSRQGVERAVGCEVVVSHDPAQVAPVAVITGHDRHPVAVGEAREHTVRNGVIALVPAPLTVTAIDLGVDEFGGDERRERLDLAEVDVVTATGSLALMQRGEHGHCAHGAGKDVGDRMAGEHRWTAPHAVVVRETRDLLGGKGERRIVTPRARSAEAREADDDDALVHRAQAFVVETEVGHDTRGVVLGDDVGFGDEAKEHGAPPLRLQVE
jgi:hypothetical protein